jgi:hypothetical protein
VFPAQFLDRVRGATRFLAGEQVAAERPVPVPVQVGPSEGV